MSHTIDVPDDLWRWAQERYGMPKPASALRDLLQQARLRDVQDRAVSMEEPAQRPVPQSDHGTTFVLRHAAVCYDCGYLIDAGEEAVIFTDQYDQRRIIHVDHRRRPKDAPLRLKKAR